MPILVGRGSLGGRFRGVAMISEFIIRWTERVMRIFVIAVGYVVVVLCGLIVVEVISRKVFEFSLQGVDEVGGYVLAVVAVFGFTYTFLRHSHTRIEIFVHRMPVRVQVALHVMAMICLSAFAVFMAVRAGYVLAQTISYGSVATTPLQTPIWIPQLVWVVGLSLFGLVSVVVTASEAFHLLRGDATLADRLSVSTEQKDR